MLHLRLSSFLAGAVIASSAMAATSFDGSGKASVFFLSDVGTFTDVLQWYKSTGEYNTIAPAYGSGAISTNYQAITAGDFDGNGTIDLFAARGDGAVIWFDSSAENAITWQKVAWNFGANRIRPNGLSSIGPSHVNSSLNRLVLVDTNGQSWTASSNGTAYGAAGQGGFASDATATTAAIGMLGSDPTKPDYLVSYAAKFQRHSVVAGTAGFHSTLTGLKQMVVGDFTGDGHNDLIAIHPDNTVGVYTTNGVDGTGLPTLLATFGSGVSSIAIGDINGTGVNQLLVGHSSSAVGWYEWIDGAPTLVSGTTFGTGGIKGIVIVPGAPIPEPVALSLIPLAGLMMARRKRQ